MQRSAFIGVFILIIILGIAMIRVPGNEENGYTIIFDDMPKISSDLIFYANREIGKIITKDEGAKKVVRITAQLDDDFLLEMGNNIAFYPDYGRLNATRLQAVGKPLPDDAIFCGFSSKLSLSWFKLKTLLENRISAANRRALNLYRQSGLT
jgi:hypothetical protein